jgi:hypothetical protein
MHKLSLIGATVIGAVVLSASPNFGKVVGRKESVRVSGQGRRRNWKTCHAGKRRRCRTESRQTSGAALRGGCDLQPLGPLH